MRNIIAICLAFSVFSGTALAAVTDENATEGPSNTESVSSLQGACNGLPMHPNRTVTHDEDVCLANYYGDYYKPVTTEGLAAQGEWEIKHNPKKYPDYYKPLPSAETAQSSDDAPVIGFLAGALVGALLFRQPVQRETFILVPHRQDWRGVH